MFPRESNTVCSYTNEDRRPFYLELDSESVTEIRMLLVLLLSAIVAVALPSQADEDGKVIDLQELLVNVSNSYKDFGQDINQLRSDIFLNVNRINENIKLTIKTVNANAIRADDNMKELLQHAKRSENNQLEAIKLLKDLIQAVGKNNIGTPSTTPTPDHQLEDCGQLYKEGQRSSGVYQVQSGEVFCDMTTDGGGWTVFQRRGDFGNPQDYFYKNWNEYKHGFGDIKKEFWMGNDRLSAFTQHRSYHLRIDLWDLEANHVYAKYSTFRIESEQLNYKLSSAGYSGTAGDSLQYQNYAFTTPDRGILAEKWGGSWWLYSGDCYTNLNGLNLRKSGVSRVILWYTWKGYYSLAFTEMKIRPNNF